MLTQERRRARAQLASAEARASRRPGDVRARREAQDARRDYYALALEDHVRTVVDRAGPLEPEQCERIARLLAPAGGGADAAA